MTSMYNLQQTKLCSLEAWVNLLQPVHIGIVIGHFPSPGPAVAAVTSVAET